MLVSEGSMGLGHQGLPGVGHLRFTKSKVCLGDIILDCYFNNGDKTTC